MVEGLKYIPQLGSYENIGYIEKYFNEIADKTEPLNYFSYNNRQIVFESMRTLGLHNAHKGIILEIGIGSKQKFLNSSTFLLSMLKSSHVHYVGIDKRNREWLYYFGRNLYVYKSRSDEFLQTFNEPIDLLMIDGGHSFKDTLTDWNFARFVKDNGIILLHDIKAHIGPSILSKLIDTNIYKVHRLFEDDDKDFGMALIYKKENDYANICSGIHYKPYGES